MRTFCTTPSQSLHKARIIQYAQHLGQTLTIIHKFAHCRFTCPPDKLLHQFQPEDWVLIKIWKTQGLNSHWLNNGWSLWCPIDNEFFPKAHKNQALYPSQMDKTHYLKTTQTLLLRLMLKGKTGPALWKEIWNSFSRNDQWTPTQGDNVSFTLFICL